MADMEINRDKEIEEISTDELENDKMLLSGIKKKLEDESVPKLSWEQPQKYDSDSDSTCCEFESICFSQTEKSKDIPIGSCTTDDEIFSLSSPIPRISNENWNSIIGMLADVDDDDDTYFSQHEIDPSLDLSEESFNKSLSLAPIQSLPLVNDTDTDKTFNILSDQLKPSDVGINQSFSPALVSDSNVTQSLDLACQTQEILPLNDITLTHTNRIKYGGNNINKPLADYGNFTQIDKFGSCQENNFQTQSTAHSRLKITDDEVMEVGKTLHESLNIVSSDTSRSSDIMSEPLDRNKQTNIRCQRGKIQRKQKKRKVKKSLRKYNDMVLMSDTPIEECMFIDTNKNISNASYSLRRKKISSRRKIEVDSLFDGDCHKIRKSQRTSSQRLKTCLSDIQVEVIGWICGSRSPLDRPRAQQLLHEVQRAQNMMMSSSKNFKAHEVEEFSQVTEKLKFQLQSLLTHDSSANLEHEDETCCCCCKLDDQEELQVVDMSPSSQHSQGFAEDMMQDELETAQTQSDITYDFEENSHPEQQDKSSIHFLSGKTVNEPCSFKAIVNDANKENLSNSINTSYPMNSRHKSLNLSVSNDATPINPAVHVNFSSKQQNLASSISRDSNSKSTTNTDSITRQNNLAASALESSAANSDEKNALKSLLNLKSKEKNLTSTTLHNEISKHLGLPLTGNNDSVESISDSKLTKTNLSQLITNTNNIKSIYTYKSKKELTVIPNSKLKEMPIANDRDESVDIKKFKTASILKQVHNKNTQSFTNKKTKDRIDVSSKSNVMKLGSNSKRVQKNKVIFVLEPKRNDHTCSIQNSNKHSTLDKSDSSKFISELKNSTSVIEGNVVSNNVASNLRSPIEYNVVSDRSDTSDINSTVCNSASTFENNVTAICMKLNRESTINTEDVLDYTDNSRSPSIPSTCVVNVDSEEIDQPTTHIDTIEQIITRIQINVGTEENSISNTSQINATSSHPGSKEQCTNMNQITLSENDAVSQNLSQGNEKQLQENNDVQEVNTEFGLTLTEAEETSFVYGIKQIWLHSASEFIPNSQLPAGFWDDIDAPIPRDLLDALEDW